MSTFSEKITYLMNIKGLTQASFGSAIGVGQTTVGQWQRGEAKPRKTTMLKIADFFSISLFDLQNDNIELNLPSNTLINAKKCSIESAQIKENLDRILCLRDSLNSAIDEIVQILNEQSRQIKNFNNKS